ncbi:hypothetical protein F66182_11013 [Fusarium sp. NRRL 66182]|nr:hypothetical protein F66182_11013 [Fusarium sp. NRRL 66182]
MDFLDELEAMAQAASIMSDNHDIHDSTITLWQNLFGYPYSVAEKEIMEHRNNPLRFTVSDHHWSIVQHRMEAEGHDRESYEHLCGQMSRNKIKQPQETTTKEMRRLRASSYLIKLEGPLNNVQAVVQAAGLSSAVSAEVMTATDSSGQPNSFFKINGMDKLAIEGWLSASPHFHFTPTFIRDMLASKELSSTSPYPTLGLDSTLPQYRLGPDVTPYPAQNQYPVWYFSYGTLTDPSVISKLFGSEFQPQYHAAMIRGGVLKTWGKYNALVDDASRAGLVHGQAFLVHTRQQEECLRAYETNVYEVVRCTIEKESGESVNGLTFRFVADMME